MREKRVVIVGGTGYLGQHLLQAFFSFSKQSSAFNYAVAFTHHTHPPPPALLAAFPHALHFHLDLRTGHGLHAISLHFGQPDIVVNCAAISVPRACEADPESAMSVNVPSALVKWLSGFGKTSTLLIHLSTDQVYEGTKSFYKEEDETIPVNVYGKSKVAAEKFISANCSNYAILRSSIIFGPQTISPVPKSLPIQWMDGVLAKGDGVEFFHDEFRCPIYVKDLVNIILALANKWISDGEPMQLLLNAGGPDRLSRFQMAEAVAQVRGYNTSSIKAVSASSVNNAAIIGVTIVDPDALITSARQGLGFINWHKVSTQNYDLAEECINTNYYGTKRMIEACIPLLQSSDSARIVNLSSLTGKLKFVCNEWATSVLADGDSLTEDRVDDILSEFLKNFEGDLLETNGWPTYLSAYTLAKAAINAYTRILAKKYPNLVVNSVCPGYVRTDLNGNIGTLTAEEGAESPVWLALLPESGPSGLFFSRKVVSPF